MVVITATITAHDGTNFMDGLYFYFGSWLYTFGYLACAKTVTDHALSARERFGGLKQQTNKLFSRPSGEVSVPPIQQDGRCN